MGFRGPLQMGSSPCIQYYRACGDLTEIQIWISSRSRYGLRTKPVYVYAQSDRRILIYHIIISIVSRARARAARRVLFSYRLAVEDLESVGRRPETLILTRLRLLVP